MCPKIDVTLESTSKPIFQIDFTDDHLFVAEVVEYALSELHVLKKGNEIVMKTGDGAHIPLRLFGTVIAVGSDTISYYKELSLNRLGRLIP